MRPLCEIAREIRKDWKNVNYAAAPLSRRHGIVEFHTG